MSSKSKFLSDRFKEHLAGQFSRLNIETLDLGAGELDRRRNNQGVSNARSLGFVINRNSINKDLISRGLR